MNESSLNLTGGWVSVYRMRWSRLLLVALVLLPVATLAPLAEASPPDPTWIGGLYDNGDHDDVILAITSAAAILDAHPIDRAAPTLVVIDSIREGGPPTSPARAKLSHQPRSPPSR